MPLKQGMGHVRILELSAKNSWLRQSTRNKDYEDVPEQKDAGLF